MSGDSGCGGGWGVHQSWRVNEARAKGMEAGDVSARKGHKSANMRILAANLVRSAAQVRGAWKEEQLTNRVWMRLEKP
jgi:hypothetical protein